MLIAVLAVLMFFAMLVATFNAMRQEMAEARVVVRRRHRDSQRQTSIGRRPW